MLNKVVLMGRLTADPELRRTQNNTAVASFSLAVNRTYSRNSEQQQTDFIDIVAWSSTAEFVAKWFKKGQMMALSGRLQIRSWEDRQGNKRRTAEVVAEEVFFADSKRDSGGPMSRNDDALAFDIPQSAGDFDELDDDSQLPF